VPRRRFLNITEGATEIQADKLVLVKIVSMRFGLIRANSDVRVFEEAASYGAREEQKGKRRSKNESRISMGDRIDPRVEPTDSATRHTSAEKYRQKTSSLPRQTPDKVRTATLPTTPAFPR
jgi:hypothetical protein